jgi:arabinose-5-phosphate isomerase
MSATRKPAHEAAPESADLEVARRVLDLEAEALRALGLALDESFTAAVDLVAGIEGRLVVTGMGKSGHVARKIAATMASTGTPALYVHPGDASHGDLGMITPSDAVLLLSNSGDTPELGDIITYARRFSIPLIAILGRADSILAGPGEDMAADVALVLPAVPEACPMGLAPTTSTTAMMALGDALAVALLERRGFSTEEFRVLHPGGRLGRSLLRVADIMHTGDEVPLVASATSMAEALLVMTSKSFGSVGVVDPQGDLIGIITDGDLRRHMGADLVRRTAGEVMTGAPKTIRARALAAEALGNMNSSKITNLFVTEGAKPIGIVHIHDCLRAGVA